MNIPLWPDDDKPREKLLEKGANALSNSELLAILLGAGSKEHNAVELARHILKHFGHLEALINASKQELFAFRGIGPAKIATIQASIELSRRHFISKPKTQTIESSHDAIHYFETALKSHSQEIFACLFIGYNHQILGFEELCQGTINQTHIHAREVAKTALKYNASSLILGHNHPTGRADASHADISATKQLIKDLRPLELHVLDHIIVGEQESVSFVDKGLM